MSITPELLDRYLASECSSNERQAAEQWINAGAGHRAFLDESKEAVVSVAAGEVRGEEAVWQRIQRRTSRSSSGPAMDRSVSHASKPHRLIPWAVAAIMLSVGGAAYGVWGARLGTESSAETSAKVYTTPRGERLAVTLDDGSRILLNGESRLEVSPEYGRKNRDLTIEGEAAFIVSHAHAHPLTVTAGKTRTAVLGTEFAVRAYPADTLVRISVKTGRVNVDGVTLVNRDVGVFTSAKTEVWHNQPVDHALAFASEQLVLDGQPLGSMKADIERWYDVTLRFASPQLATQKIEATLHGGSISDLVGMLELLLDARVERNGNELVLYAKSGVSR